MWLVRHWKVVPCPARHIRTLKSDDYLAAIRTPVKLWPIRRNAALMGIPHAPGIALHAALNP
jgi:hypothetical protein